VVGRGTIKLPSRTAAATEQGLFWAFVGPLMIVLAAAMVVVLGVTSESRWW